MSFTVDDFQDLLRVLERHPEWRAELRRHVLSDELLALPPLVRELAAAQVRTEQSLAQLTEGVAALVKQIAALTGQVEGILVRLDRHEDRLGRLEGDLLELRYASRAPAYFAPLARRLRVIDSAALADLLDEAIEKGQLGEVERADLLLADLVLRGRRRVDGAEMYLLAEISVGVGPDDVRRAADRAAMLTALGRPVVPVVAGRWITPPAAALAGTRGVRQVLNGAADPPADE